MTHLQTSQNQLENQTQISEITASLLVAFERTACEPSNIENMVRDISQEFNRTSLKDIQLAIRNGSLGKYGKTYKFSTQEVCIWIREFIKEKNKQNVVF